MFVFNKALQAVVKSGFDDISGDKRAVDFNVFQSADTARLLNLVAQAQHDTHHGTELAE